MRGIICWEFIILIVEVVGGLYIVVIIGVVDSVNKVIVFCFFGKFVSVVWVVE